MTEIPLPRVRSMRVRMAIGLALAVLVVTAFVTLGAAAIASWRGNADDVVVGAARVGDDVTVLIVDGDGSAAAAARASTLQWSLIALGVSVIPAAALGWVVSGRMLSTVGSTLDEVEAAEQERHGRLQEVIHELRTPLAVMGTNLELAATGPDVDDETAGFVEAARRALDRMDRTVDDLAGHGGLAVEHTDSATDIAAVAADVVAEFTGPAHRRGLHLTAIETGPVVAESAEEPALRTVIGNLVANAVRLAPRGSVIAVDSGSTGDWAWGAVSDEGPGIPVHDHARVFERGWQGPHTRHRAGDDRGGLGLTIARQLAEAQGGNLTVTSAEGGGSTFTVWLPLTPDAASADVVDTDGIHPALEPWRQPSPVS